MKVKLENKTKIYKEFTCSLMNILITFLRGKKGYDPYNIQSSAI